MNGFEMHREARGQTTSSAEEITDGITRIIIVVTAQLLCQHVG
jgi:hypothetical protein